MRAMLAVLFLVSGCAAGVDNGVPPIGVVVDPSLEAPARAALAEWHDVTGAAFDVVVAPVGGAIEGKWTIGPGAERPHVARTYGPERDATYNYIRLDPVYSAELGYTTDDLRKALLHEVGHALRITFEGEDRWHYFGTEPSAMTTEMTTAAAHLGRPEVEAYWRTK